MCLISNAIKYSCGGSVVVCCYLIDGAPPVNVTSPSVKTQSDTMASPSIKIAPDTDYGHFLVVEVEDSGIGISLEKRQLLFAPFQRAQRMATGGTGLGLYSLRKRIESLGGECGINDRRDGKQGTVVWFSFPYRPDQSRSCSISAESSVDGHSTPKEYAEESLSVLRRKAKLIGEAANRINRLPVDRMRYPTNTNSHSKLSSATPKSQRHTNPASPSMTPLSHTPSQGSSSCKGSVEGGGGSLCKLPPCILIVDDSMSILKMCRRAMERAGFTVTIVENGFLALDILLQKHKEFDVILTDLQMPVMV